MELLILVNSKTCRLLNYAINASFLLENATLTRNILEPIEAVPSLLEFIYSILYQHIFTSLSL
jgi:hypothetical protein